MKKKLLIVFAKNKQLGKVKTRLAATIGDEAALRVYERLLSITEEATKSLNKIEVRIYYSNAIDSETWVGFPEKFVQSGETLGDRMLNAFERGFKDGYDQIVGIGADLDQMDGETIEQAHQLLASNDFVFGPAEDGGYYLIGINGEKGTYVFDNKPWSTSDLLKVTLEEIDSKNDTYTLLDTRNDIDQIEDLQKSTLAEEFLEKVVVNKNSR